MAELKKVEDFIYDTQIMEESTPVMDPQHEEKKVLKKGELPQSPKKHLKNISRLEKVLGFLLISAIIGIAILTVQVRTAITQASNEITAAKATIEQKEEKALKLEQEKTELSKADRIREVAKNKGLSEIDGNLRNVK